MKDNSLQIFDRAYMSMRSSYKYHINRLSYLAFIYRHLPMAASIQLE